MKLAEALQERADLNKKIEELRRRLTNVVLVQEGEDPAEDPAELLKELEGATVRLEQLMAAINLTNCRTRADGRTLTELIAKKDALTLKLSAYRDLVYTAGQNTSRARGTEIRVKALLKASDLQREADSMAKEIRELDNLLQETNWKTKLIEK
ncbi:MAG: DIP1984 family protein [Oscillospiraceae bacterium]|nr:DIP1984 family protein [Oscillospiraceae bacterium]